jgi:hypothetical protein
VLYVLLGVVGMLGIIIGVALGFADQTVGGFVVGSIGAFLAAIGLIGFGVSENRKRRSPATRLQDEKAKEELAEREQQRLKQEAEEQARQQLEERRQTQLRDLQRIRKAIIAELQKLGESSSLTFAWGHTQGDNELREYRIMQGRFMVAFQHMNRRSGWSWPEGSIPSPPDNRGERAWDVTKPEDVNKAYLLLQPERYLVSLHLPDDPLELPEPGYVRWGSQGT